MLSWRCLCVRYVELAMFVCQVYRVGDVYVPGMLSWRCLCVRYVELAMFMCQVC